MVESIIIRHRLQGPLTKNSATTSRTSLWFFGMHVSCIPRPRRSRRPDSRTRCWSARDGCLTSTFIDQANGLLAFTQNDFYQNEFLPTLVGSKPTSRRRSTRWHHRGHVGGSTTTAHSRLGGPRSRTRCTRRSGTRASPDDHLHPIERLCWSDHGGYDKAPPLRGGTTVQRDEDARRGFVAVEHSPRGLDAKGTTPVYRLAVSGWGPMSRARG